MAKQVKVLLLGAGESGKSTILKQMKVLYASGFTSAERRSYRRVIFSNILDSMRIVHDAMLLYQLDFETESNKGHMEFILDQDKVVASKQLPLEYLEPLKCLWADEAVQETIRRGHEFALHDNLSCYFQDVDRLFAKDYIPTDQDILWSRLKTTGIAETMFDLGSHRCQMFDVGGQRSERRKWIHCFENVDSLLFLVAISGYDQCLVEDREGNQMLEALMLFESIANSRWFKKTAIILFLNKIDLFEKKLPTSPITKYFPDYEGDSTNVETASNFFKDKFLALNRNGQKVIYSHFTNATSTSLFKVTMNSVQDIIVRRSLDTMMVL